MSEEDTRNARKRKRTSQSKRYIAPDNVPVDLAWIGAPPKAKLPKGADGKPIGKAGPPQQGPAPNNQNPYLKPGPPQQGPAPNNQNPYLKPGPPQQGPAPNNQNPYLKPGPPQQGPLPNNQNPYLKPGPPQQGPAPNNQNPYLKPGPPQQGPLPNNQNPYLKPGPPQQGPLPNNQNPYLKPGPPQQGPLPNNQNPYLNPGPPQQGPLPNNQNPYLKPGPPQQGPAPNNQNPYLKPGPPQQGPLPNNQNPYLKPGPPQQGPLPDKQNHYANPEPHQQSPIPQQFPAGFQQPPIFEASLQNLNQQTPLTQAAVHPTPAYQEVLNSPELKRNLPEQASYDENPGDALRSLNAILSETGSGQTALLRKRRVTKSWYWPEADENESGSEAVPVPTKVEPLGLLPGKAGESSEAKTALAQSIDEFALAGIQTEEARNTKFENIAHEFANKRISSEADARATVDRLALSLDSKALCSEILELSPRLSTALSTSDRILRSLVLICAAIEARSLNVETAVKVFEQLNRLYDAKVNSSKRDLAVQHFLLACEQALQKDNAPDLKDLELTCNFLLSKYPDRAAELLLSVLTASKINSEELAIRAYKFDRERSKNAIKVAYASLEPWAEMKNEKVAEPNFFLLILKTLAINALLQEKDSRARYECKAGLELVYTIEEEKAKSGFAHVRASAKTNFAGLNYEEVAWINRQFSGLRVRGKLPDRLKYWS